MTSQNIIEIARVALSIIAAIIAVIILGDSSIGWSIFFGVTIFLAAYMWAGFFFTVFELLWKLVARPNERLFAIVMLTSMAFILALLAGAYWLIRDSIGVGATLMYALGAYVVISIVMWFRRHTASYYATLEAEKNESVSEQIENKRDA